MYKKWLSQMTRECYISDNCFGVRNNPCKSVLMEEPYILIEYINKDKQMTYKG